MDRASPLSLVETEEAARTIVSVKSDSALAMEYLQTLTDSEKFDLHEEVK